MSQQTNKFSSGSEHINSIDQSILPCPQFIRGKSLTFDIQYSCNRARSCILKLPHGKIYTPIFMPVATHGAIKGLSTAQVEELNVPIILGNAYHLSSRPGVKVIKDFGGLHKFMNWNRNLLTDSGGFQMVSLLKFANITEEGVTFKHPYTNATMIFTPEKSIEYQNSIGADIIMQLDDVVSAQCTNYERIKEAVGRTTRWLDRCIKAHKRPYEQNLFGIVQGGVYKELREQSLKDLIARDLPGYAIGGLSGGETKDDFWPIIELCTHPVYGLPYSKPRYVMGVGYTVDILICVALGADMFDCVYPCRTARFGTAMVKRGLIKLKLSKYSKDLEPIDKCCECYCCKHYTRAALHSIVSKESLSSQLITIHNITFMMKFCSEMRESIKDQTFPEYCQQFLLEYYSATNLDHLPINYEQPKIPSWIIDAMEKAQIHIEQFKT
ncbi:queuine tRNA-ribosyltransferase family protein [Cryptosporidium muris RN66]|uniref:Queuine tRNA-ribosyltransferase catalytic subunit 1 n=1 Tax=Cryptosporidium muris (strain RN66) TaxID=441375 RepID=B6AFA1_CRYMR|nr:queuine tRNA-ribosyltransferase family protein [Cryptosporidium muris RN66]EEA06892.1 queuine tRNA-ribosyltransferase family protein [Cryptosporidium muris RN66]|eukprot:XP_002141241.1 queuine tRNA-ribosyltransferase family protein [Cryptosporidium muris RN66]